MSVRRRGIRQRLAGGDSAIMDLEDLWPVFSDVSLALVLLLTFALIVQFIELSQVFQELKVKRAQEDLWTALVDDPFFGDLHRNGTLIEERQGSLQRFRFSGDIVFELGSADLQDRGREILTRFAGFMSAHADEHLKVEVEGHTDRKPVNSPFYKDNWELSAERALTVVRLFQELGAGNAGQFALAPSVMSAVGYGEHRPIELDAIESETNRRVEIRLDYSSIPE